MEISNGLKTRNSVNNQTDTDTTFKKGYMPSLFRENDEGKNRCCTGFISCYIAN